MPPMSVSVSPVVMPEVSSFCSFLLHMSMLVSPTATISATRLDKQSNISLTVDSAPVFDVVFLDDRLSIMESDDLSHPLEKKLNEMTHWFRLCGSCPNSHNFQTVQGLVSHSFVTVRLSFKRKNNNLEYYE